MMADRVSERRMVTTIGPGGERRRVDPACPWYEEVICPGGDRYRRYGSVWCRWVAPHARGAGGWMSPVDPPVIWQQLDLQLD